MPSNVVSNYISSTRERVSNALSASVLIAESNHRIANNLTLIAGLLHLKAKEIRVEGRPLTPEEACEVLQEVGVRVEAVGRLHRLLAADGDGAVDLSQYLDQIGQAAIGSMSPMGNVALSVKSEGACTVTADYALQAGLVVGELVTNAIKHAHPAKGLKSRIELGCCEQVGGAMLIWVSDDGVGLPEGFDPERDGGLGMRTLRAIASQMRATLSFQSSELGLTVRLRIPAVD